MTRGRNVNGRLGEGEGSTVTHLTNRISNPSVTSGGRSLVSFRFCAGRSTVLTPARRAPISFSLMPPTAVTRPRREISPCLPQMARVRTWFVS